MTHPAWCTRASPIHTTHCDYSVMRDDGSATPTAGPELHAMAERDPLE
jgi:hypothetical protein